MGVFEVVLIAFLITANLCFTESQQTVCKESSVADIVFLVDGSWSIGSQNFRRVREFLYTLVNAFDVGEDKVRIGLVQYSSTPRTEFLLNSYSSKTEILQYLQQLPYKGGGTRTGLALDFMLNNHFTESAGSRAVRGVPQVAIVLTDGQSQDSVRLPAQALKNKGITVVAIGIRDAVEKELYDIASDPPETYVYNTPDFAALRGISQVVVQLLCTTVEEGAVKVTQALPEFELSPVCTRATVADIVFIVDGSTSISNENFEDIKAFLSTFVRGLDIGRDKVRIGLVQYSDNPNTEFLLSRFASKQDILNYLRRLTQKGGGTNTRTALEFLRTQHFIPAAGSREGENVRQIAVLITDGGSTTEVGYAAQQLKQGSVTTYVVGIDIQDKQELELISSKPTEKYVYDVASFNMLKALAVNVLESVCLTVEAHNQAFAVRYADVVFLVDGSQNMGASGFQQIRNFIFRIVSQLDVGVGKFRIGLGQFGANARTEFLLNTYQNRAEVINYIRSGRSFAFRGGPALRTGSAIDYLLKTFFTESAGSRKKEGVPQIAVIITSASSQDEVTVSARALRNHGVKVISIGVRNSELTEMKKLAFLPNFPFVFQISAFSALVQLSNGVSTAIKMIVRREFLNRELKAPEVCRSASVADIVFLVDESDSIGAVNFQLIRSFLYNFVDILEVSPGHVHIGLAQYSDIPMGEFYLNRYRNKSDVLDHIKSMTYRGGGRNTEAALNFVQQTYFTERFGSRARIGIPQFLIVITGGESQDKLVNAAPTLRRTGVIMFALGIQNANETELRQVASYPSRNYISTIDDYMQLSAIERNFHKKVCSEIVRQTAVAPERAAILQKGCTETEEADIFFLIDGSGSIQPNNFQDMKMFMNEVAKAFRIGANKVRIGVAQFASAPRTEFGITQYTTSTELEMAINRIVQIGGGTEVGRALTYMKTLFREAAKTRRNPVQRFLIIITDGQSEDSVEIPAAELRQEGIINYAIGAGEADPAELLLIGGFQERVFYVTSLDFLSDLKNSILREICSVEACSKLDTVDIIFLIDGSGSISVEDFAKIKMFMNTIVNKSSIGADKVQVGAIQFGSYPRTEFQLDAYSTKPDLQQAIYNIQQLGGGTQTGRALTFTANYFDEDRGGRPNTAQYLIVITDGEAQDQVYAPAKALRDKGITVFAIGVFNANSTQLLEIGGSPDKVYFVENFDDLNDPEKQIFWEICSVPQDCTRTDVGDIVFVIDGSGSIQPNDFESMKRFMVALVNNSDVAPDKVRFGAVVYGTTPVVQFQLNQYKTKNEVREAIYDMQREGGSTFTALALKEAKGLLAIEKGGRRSDRVAQFLIVITDGKATDAVKVPDTSKDIRDDGINVYAVGIAEANEEELQTIVGPTGNYFYVQNFDTLKSITRSISKMICTNTNPECKLQQADIVFLIDGSESIESEDFSQMKVFMKNIVNVFDIAPNKVQIGLAQFSALFRKEFFLKDFSDGASLIAEIERVVQMKQGTNIGFALTNVNSLFTREAGSRKADGVPQFLLLITDGRSNDDVVIPANALRNENINIFALGTGKADVNQLLQITASQDAKYFVENMKDIEKIKPRMVRKICQEAPSKECAVDVAVGFDVPRQNRFYNIFSGQQRLQTHLSDILQRMMGLRNISCTSYLNIRVGFHIKNEARGIVFESNFEKYNENILKKLKEVRLSRTDQVDLTATYLQSFSSKFERESGTNVKVILIFTDGVDDSMDRLKETSDRLKLGGVNMLITVALENAPSLDDIPNIEFGRGFGYRRRLTIGMRDIGSVLLTEIDTVAERKCCNVFCKCVGQQGRRGLQGGQGFKGFEGPKGVPGYPGEEGGTGDRGLPGVNGTEGVEGCQGPRGPKGARGYQGKKGEEGVNGINGIVGEQGNPGLSGLPGVRGDLGNPGLKGSRGLKGDRGARGLHGDPGAPGINNYARGVKGGKGYPGSQGDSGRSGIPGDIGSIGYDGRPGRRGFMGEVGEKGESGDSGPFGPPGFRGQQGFRGIIGMNGIKGQRGLPGLQGPPGVQAFKGSKGNNGLKGQKGEPGDPGNRGSPGPLGPRGLPGLDGNDIAGKPGPKGEKGIQGFPGYPGAQGMDGEAGTPGEEGSRGARGRRGDAGASGNVGNPGDAGGVGTRGFKGPPGITSMKSCELVSYVRDNCPCCSSGGNECPVYPTELVFALDTSADVTQAAFDRMKAIVANFLQELKISESNCPSGARVAVLTYSSTTKTLIRFSDFKRKNRLLEKVRNLTYERSTSRRNIGAAMRFVARNTLKRVRGGVLVKKVAVFIVNGPSRNTSTISTAALEFSALDIIPVVISFNKIPEVQRAFQVDDTKTFQVVVLPRQLQEARERLRRIQQCTFCLDMCEPNQQCQQVLLPAPIPISMDIAFIVDGSRNVRSADFQRLKIFLSSILDELVTSRTPRTLDNYARVALVQHAPRDYVPGSGQQPVHLEFGFFNFSSKRTMKRYIEESFDQLEGSSGVGGAIEWTLNNVFATAPSARRYKVLFLIVAGYTSVWDKAKLLAASLHARCQGFSVFTFSFGMDTETDLEDLVSFPFDQHLIRLGRLLEPEMRYAHRFTRAFLKSLTLGINRYPPQALLRECQSARLFQRTTEISTPLSVQQGRTVEEEEEFEEVEEFEEELEEEEFEEKEVKVSERAETTMPPENGYEEMQSEDVCALNQDEGSCQDYDLKWHFDKELQGCTRFWYGGCKGNANRFDTEEECEALCLKSR